MAGKRAWAELNPRYIVNADDERVAVVLDYAEYLALLEQLEYDADVAAAEAAPRGGAGRSWRAVREELEG